MTIIDARDAGFQEVNQAIRNAENECSIINCLGQRFIAAGAANHTITITGTPGNALGSYLNGAHIEVFGNAQDAVGDTMNDGEIIVHGNVGDGLGYAMRGGKIYVQGNAGYRAGIHMKAYEDKFPVMMIGGKVGSFLGEYQAGGLIIVLGLTDAENTHTSPLPIVSNFPGTGMHGGKMVLRSACEDIAFPEQVETHPAGADDLAEIAPYVEEFAELFGYDAAQLMDAPFTVVLPNSSNPYRQLYVSN